MSTHHGTVTAFDREVGLGEVTTPDGTAVLFHCIEIADGTRTLEVGAVVEFALIGKLGRYEAAGITPA